MSSLAHARTLYHRAHESGDWERFNAYLAQLMEPPKPRVAKRPRKRKEVTPPPIMQTIFADGRVCRMTIAQFEDEPLPVEKAIRIAQGVYYDHVCDDVPEAVSCEQVNGQPRPENCGLVSYPPSERSRETLQARKRLCNHTPGHSGQYNGVPPLMVFPEAA